MAGDLWRVLHEHLPKLGYRTKAEAAISLLSEVLRNAVQASAGKEGLCVRVVVEDKDGKFRFSVSNTGPGVSREAAPRLFGCVGARYFPSTEGLGVKLGLMWLGSQSHREFQIKSTLGGGVGGPFYSVTLVWSPSEGRGVAVDSSADAGEEAEWTTEVSWMVGVESVEDGGIVLEAVREFIDKAQMGPGLSAEFHIESMRFGCSTTHAHRDPPSESSGLAKAVESGVSCSVRVFLSPSCCPAVASKRPDSERNEITLIRSVLGIPLPRVDRCDVWESVQNFRWERFGVKVHRDGNRLWGEGLRGEVVIVVDVDQGWEWTSPGHAGLESS
eukprot:Hpha_TRINITY_DN1771_c0_g1::TRINITY_DN1771_c0_g1_i1::g.158487::m.158487